MRAFTVLENAWITLADGTRLAARIWMPDGAAADPVPAVLEYLPYRKRDGTCARDEATYPAFARAGYAGVRVDIRGSGESDGVIDGEYTPRELADACEVIAWIAAQPWCTGAVGMMGISWGGFNSLQVAALKPPALKAVISIASTVDRYNDDIHYKNGCHLSAQLSWAATMLAYQSRPPDPALVGDRWRAMWLERLAAEPFFMEEWLLHQRRDAFWRHGSIGEDFAGFPIPALVIAGWADGYRSTPLKAVEGLGRRAKALIGPWVHKYPHFAYPHPRADFLAEAIRWWDRWLKDEPNGADAVPAVRAYILEAVRPALRRDADPGRWVALEEWAPSGPPLTLYARPGRRLSELAPETKTETEVRPTALRSPLDCGTAAGEWFTLKPDAELPGDQRGDDGGSLVFETTPLREGVDVLGAPTVRVTLTPELACGNLCARLVDVHPDGAATRVAFGVLNLAHRTGNAEPEPVVPGKPLELTLTLDACGYRFAPGHRIRLSLSTAYWPTILPPPEDGAVLVDEATVRLDLPRLPPAARAAIVAAPDDPDPLPRYRIHQAGGSERRIERDQQRGVTRLVKREDTGLVEHPGTGLATRQVQEEVWSIALADPLSATGETRWTTEMRRGDWNVRTLSTTRLGCTATDYVLAAEVVAFDDDREVHRRRFARTIPRDFT